jgi:hypothetical protein
MIKNEFQTVYIHTENDIFSAFMLHISLSPSAKDLSPQKHGGSEN